MKDYKMQNASLCTSLEVLEKELDSLSAEFSNLSAKLGPLCGMVKSLSAGEIKKDTVSTKSRLVEQLDSLIEKVCSITHSVKYTNDVIEI